MGWVCWQLCVVGRDDSEIEGHTPQSSAELETHMRLSADGSDYQDQIALARNPTELIIHTRSVNLS